MSIGNRIDGERIFLEVLHPDSLSENYVAWMSDPEILRFLANPQATYSASDLKDFVAQMNQSDSNYLFGIFLKESGRHIGNIKIGNVHPIHKHADIGLIIGDKTLWGHGFATSAIRLAVDYAFDVLKLHKLFAGILEDNKGSLKAFLKAGFMEAGCYKKHYCMGGKYCDSHIVEILHE